MPPKIRRVESLVLAAWSKRGALAILLLPLAAVFFCLTAVRRKAYSSGLLRVASLPVPVVVVGNINSGGTGKTPLVINLVDHLKRHGHKPGVISRGYGGRGQGGVVLDGADPTMFGDEPLLIRARTSCPVVVNRNRVEAAKLLLQHAPETTVIISDDGMQHYALPRQIEIAVVNAHGFMNGWLLPAGPMRESMSRLRNVDAVVGNGINASELGSSAVPFFQMNIRAGNFFALHDRQRRVTSTNWHGKKVHAVAGIGHPERFFQHLKALDIVSTDHAFPDHHDYRAEELDFYGDAILTTEKDAVKLARLSLGLPVWVLPIDAVLEPNLADFIVKKLVEKNRGFPTT
ncbi:MAG: tetraacyldisaccharide 4'-kinase [Rhodocyclaceae bacterium]|nr:tetraacyldisaccharide 4'-kinase [Rhodocyclaceae bacterium]